MDLDPPRDPRLANRASRPSLSTGWGQHEAQRRPPSGPRQRSTPAAQNDASSDQFIRGIAELVQTAVSTATDKSEREKIKKKRVNTDDLLRRAKVHAGFPSTLEYLHSARSDEERVLASIDEKIKNHETHEQRIFDDLRTKWAASTAPKISKSEDKLPQLQQDLELANKKISSLQEVVARLTSRGTSVDIDLKKLQEILGDQQKTVGGYTNSWDLLKKDVEEQSMRLKQLEESTKPPVDEVSSDTKKALDDISAQYKNLEHKTAKWGEKIGFLSSSYRRISELPDQLNRSLKDQQQKLDQLASSRSANSKLDNAVLALNHKMEELQNIQSTKDDLLFAEMEDFKANLNKAEQGQERLTETVKETLLRTPKEPIDPKVDALIADIRKWHSLLEPINMALHSLESRYNNLSTEPIVQHMVGAMQEMYPSVDQIWRELQSHKRTLGQELPLLQTKIKQLEDQRGNSTLPHDALDSLKAEHNDLSLSFGAIVERYQWLNQEEFRGMQARLESLAEKQINTDGVIQQKQTANQDFLQEINHERESLNNRLTSLHDAFEKLNSEYTQEKSGAANNEDMCALEVRITALEKNTAHSYEKLKGQFDGLKERVQLQDAASESRSLQHGSTSKTQVPPPLRPDLRDGPLGMRIKRRYSSHSDDGRSLGASNSPLSFDSTASPIIPSGDPKKKKKKKRRLESEAQAQTQAQTQEPITIED